MHTRDINQLIARAHKEHPKVAAAKMDAIKAL
jgi:hypothetical protein